MNIQLISAINLLNKDDKIKFEQLFHRYKNYAFSICLHYLKNTQDAEDAVQEAFLRIMKNMDKLGSIESKSTKGFISVVTRNICLDKLKKPGPNIDYDNEKPLVEPSNFTENLENKDSIHYYLKNLKEKYQYVLILTYLNEMNDTQIASSLGLSQVNVRKIRSRALQQIKNYISEDDYER